MLFRQSHKILRKIDIDRAKKLTNHLAGINYEEYTSKMNEDTLINSHIEDEASYEIDLLFFTYFHLFEKDVGIPATS